VHDDPKCLCFYRKQTLKYSNYMVVCSKCCGRGLLFQKNITLLKADPKSYNAAGVACFVSGEHDPVEGGPKVK